MPIRIFSVFTLSLILLLCSASCTRLPSNNSGINPDTLEALSLEELFAVQVTGKYKGAGIYQSPEAPVDKQTVNFAVLMPLGSFPKYSASLFAAADLAAERINASGGINGKRVAILRVDITDSRSSAVKLAQQVVTEYQISALFGPGATDEVMAVMKKVSIPLNIPLVTVSASSNRLAELSPQALFWRMSPSNEQQASTIVEYLKQRNKGERIALVSGKGIYGQELASSIRQALPNSQFKEFKYSSLVNLKRLNVQKDLLSIKKFKPDTIIFSLHSNIIESYLTELEKSWSESLPILISGDVLIKADKNRVVNYKRVANCLNIVMNDDSLPQKIKIELHKKFNYELFGSDAAYIYDGILLMAQAIELQQITQRPLTDIIYTLTAGNQLFNGLEAEQARSQLRGMPMLRYVGASGPIRFDDKGNNNFAKVNIEKYWGNQSEDCY